jgi:hypothetical protein
LTIEVDVPKRTICQARRDRDGKLRKTEAHQYELSRKLLLNDPKSGGFVRLDNQAASDLPSAGNDDTFASDQHDKHIPEPILVRLATRCMACHAGSGQVMTFNRHGVVPLPPVALLKPSENTHAGYVVGRKLGRKDFKALQDRWRTPAEP